jgi:uncharacterized membrane protein
MIRNISELVNAGVITQETADSIENYYKNKRESPTNRLFIVFGILGAILLGSGIILIIAHNWDELSKSIKTSIAFFPLLLAQFLCGYILIKKHNSTAWRESGTAFLFFAVGACIALVSQIYNIPGETDTFLLTWMLLCLPLIYLMKSSVTSLLYLCGITYYASLAGYFSYSSSETHWYWLLLLAILPHYYVLYKNKPDSNFMIFHNWLIPLSVIIALGTVVESNSELILIAYLSLFGLFYLMGNLDFFKNQRMRNSGYEILGSAGTIVLLLVLSFGWFWEELRDTGFRFNLIVSTPEFLASVLTSLLAGGLFYLYRKNKSLNNVSPLSLVFILFILTFIVGLYSPFAVVLINLYVFAIGIFIIKNGARKDHLGTLNFGLLIIAALAVCRFFDENLSFVIRGLLFAAVGIGFFAANYWVLKRRKA